MNLMVVLVPFLLTTAVFSRTSILTIDVPTPASQSPNQATPPPPAAPDKVPFRLVVQLAADGVVVIAGSEQTVPVPRNAAGDYDTDAIREALTAIQQAHPSHTAIDILSRPNTPYAELVAVMDADGDTDGGLLFPDIRLGEFTP